MRKREKRVSVCVREREREERKSNRKGNRKKKEGGLSIRG